MTPMQLVAALAEGQSHVEAGTAWPRAKVRPAAKMQSWMTERHMTAMVYRCEKKRNNCLPEATYREVALLSTDTHDSAAGGPGQVQTLRFAFRY